MSNVDRYTPPAVWRWQSGDALARLSKINRPVAGSTHERELDRGRHPLQLYSAPTPNGQKVSILLEELLAEGIVEAEYDAWLVNFLEGEQFGSGFTEINPNSKIPALIDYSVNPSVPLFESGSILLYLAEKFCRFLPEDPSLRANCLSWLFWQVGSAPFLGGGFGHFYAYAPEKLEYPINRFTMEAKRLLDVMNQRLEEREFLCGDEYTIADIATFPWYASILQGKIYDAVEFLNASSYEHVLRWIRQIEQRPAVIRGLKVNTIGEGGVPERHSASDLD